VDTFTYCWVMVEPPPLPPVSGVVLTPYLHERVGSYVEAGAPFAWIGDPDWIELELRVAQEDVGLVRLGQPVRARVSAYPALTFRGHVASIAPRAEQANGVPTYTVRALLDNRERLLRSGMTARARVHTDSRPQARHQVRPQCPLARKNHWF
jgi:HlyD family secretion protein